MAKRDPQAVTTDQEILALILGELRVLNTRLGGDEDAQRRPAVADGLRVYEEGPSRGEGDRGEETPQLDEGDVPGGLSILTEPEEPADEGGVDSEDFTEPEDGAYCADCDRTFASPQGLAAHNRAKHGG